MELKNNPPSLQTSKVLYQTIITGKSQLIPYIDDETYKSYAKTPEELKLLHRLNIRSVIIVPLKINNQTVGAIEFFSTKNNKTYTAKDLKIAEDLASRASLAIENSLLYSDAQKAIQTRDDFISIASHELRTPLASMQLYIELLTKRLAPISLQNNKIVHPLTKISAQVTKLTNLINDLLNVSRIQLGKLEFNMQDIDLQKIIYEVTENMQITTQQKINIYGEVATPVYADPDRIGQVYTNLLSNAIKYSPSSKPINVFITPLTKTVKVTVQDFGIGISPSNLSKIFDRFYRGEITDENTYPGLGVGLYISHQIINRHNGKLTVKSKLNHGSSFTFSLPYR